MSQATLRIWIEFSGGKTSFVQWGRYIVPLNYRQAESLVQTMGLADKTLFHPKAYDLYYNQGA